MWPSLKCSMKPTTSRNILSKKMTISWNKNWQYHGQLIFFRWSHRCRFFFCFRGCFTHEWTLEEPQDRNGTMGDLRMMFDYVRSHLKQLQPPFSPILKSKFDTYFTSRVTVNMAITPIHLVSRNTSLLVSSKKTNASSCQQLPAPLKPLGWYQSGRGRPESSVLSATVLVLYLAFQKSKEGIKWTPI